MTFFKRHHNHHNTTSNSTTAPRLLVRKRNSSIHRSISSSRTMSSDSLVRSVRFSEQPPVVESIDHVTPNEEEQVWFPMEYLQAARKEEIKNNLRAQYFQKPEQQQQQVCIESDQLTWRGMEDILEKYNKKDKVYGHVQAVLNKYKSQKDPNCLKAQHALRQFARSLSKADRHKAIKLAAQDAKLATGKTPAPMSGGMRPLAAAMSRSLKRGVRRSLSPATIRLSLTPQHGGRSSPPGRRSHPGHRKTNSLDLFNWKFPADNEEESSRTMQSDHTHHQQQQQRQEVQ